MIIDIVTGKRFSKTSFYQEINKWSGYALFSDKVNHYDSRYIMEKNWNELVVVLIDDSGAIYNCVAPHSLEHYLGPLDSKIEI